MPLHGYSRQLREEVLANYLFFSHCSIGSIAAFFRVQQHTAWRGRCGDHTQKAKKKLFIIIAYRLLVNGY